MNIIHNQIYTTEEIADFLKVSQITIKRYVSENKIASIKINGLRRFKGESILNLLNNSQSEVMSTVPVVTRTHTDITQFTNKVLEGDCLDVMPRLPDKSIDMILCDLPYGTTQNSWDSVIPLNKLWNQYERIIKDRGVIALTAHGVFTAALILSEPDLFKYKLVWVKSKSTNFLNAKKQPLRKHEDICIFYKKQPLYNPQMSPGLPFNKGFRKNQLTGSYGTFNPVEVKSNGDRYPNDVIYFKTAESEGKIYHPTQKPVELGRYLIKTHTRPGDIVLDNACGSGSFLVSAILENRKFIGIEKNKETYLHKNTKVDYLDVCNQRIEQVLNKMSSEEQVLF
ncbi:MAG: DNA methyltransferase [Patescibacteria group bacterium]